MFFAQLLIAGLLILGLIVAIRNATNGRQAAKATGFAGVVVALIVNGLMWWCYAAAGAFSLLLS